MTMDASDTQGQVLNALFFAASFQGPGHFVTRGDLIQETALPPDGLTACVQTLLLRGFVREDEQGAVQITRAGIAAIRG
jgi:hypothetical protein